MRNVFCDIVKLGRPDYRCSFFQLEKEEILLVVVPSIMHVANLAIRFKSQPAKKLVAPGKAGIGPELDPLKVTFVSEIQSPLH